jgi:murein DD-endopeptidase MepM/ murein hydrolase activator NlpD
MTQFPFADKKPRKISSPFGPRVHPITKVKGKNHNGVDMVDRSGTAIVAPEKGLVLESRKSTAAGGGYGFYVKLKGASGTVHIFAHMIEGSLAVRKGQRIQQGALLGKMGTTGASTGVHLHWETQVRGTPIDPMLWAKKNIVEDKPAPKPVATPTPKPPKPTKPTRPEVHVVKRGDTLSGIGKKYGASVNELVKLNKIDNPNLIRVGQRIELPKWKG